LGLLYAHIVHHFICVNGLDADSAIGQRKTVDMQTESREDTEYEIELPLVNVTEENVLDVIMSCHNYSESLRDGILKIETWIMNFAEEQIAPLRESGCLSEDEIDEIKKKMCVISPITLTLYTHWCQMEMFIKMPDSEKEKELLNKAPDRFKARYKGNAANRQARETSTDEEIAKTEEVQVNNAEDLKKRQSMTFLEFLKEFGEEVKASVKGNEGKAA
jgi:hypothetical protein